MGGRRVALVWMTALTAVVVSGVALAQPADPGDIEIDPEQPGSGSAGSNAPEAAPSTRPPPATPVKDPKLAKKWLTAGQQLMQKGSALAARNRLEEARSQFE